MAARHKSTEREDIRSETRQHILDAAANEFAQYGPSKANVNRIAEAAGYSVGTVYNYFPSKKALLQAVIDETAGIHFDLITAPVLAEESPTLRLECFYQAGFDFVRDHLPRARLLFDVINGADEDLKSHIFAAYQPMFQFVAQQIIAPGIEAGTFKAADPASTAMLMMTIYLGTAAQHDPQGQPWIDPAQVADLVLYGIVQKETSDD